MREVLRRNNGELGLVDSDFHHRLCHPAATKIENRDSQTSFEPKKAKQGEN